MKMKIQFSPIADVDLGGSGITGNCHAEIKTRPRKQHIIPCDSGYNLEDINFDHVDIKMIAPKLDLTLQTLKYMGEKIDINLSETGEMRAENRLIFNDLIIEKKGNELHVFSEKMKVYFHGEHV